MEETKRMVSCWDAHLYTCLSLILSLSLHSLLLVSTVSVRTHLVEILFNILSDVLSSPELGPLMIVIGRRQTGFLLCYSWFSFMEIDHKNSFANYGKEANTLRHQHGWL